MNEVDLRVEVHNGVGLMVMNRPEKMNALSADMNRMAQEALREFAADPKVGAVVLTGEGRGFCGGGDVSAMHRGEEIGGKGASLETKIDALRQGQQFSWLLHSIPKVTIAAINGAAAGAGLGLALSCDLRYMSDRAKLTTAYARVGYGGDYGTTWGLTHLVGPARAKELFFLPDPIGADLAERMGLVNGIFPSEQLLPEVMAVAERIARGPQVSYRYMKANVNAAVTMDYRTMLDREAETHIRCGETEDHAEGVAAFMEKREPSFKGR